MEKKLLIILDPGDYRRNYIEATLDGINFTTIWESQDLSVTSRVKVFERDKEIVIYDASTQSVIIYEIPVTD